MKKNRGRVIGWLSAFALFLSSFFTGFARTPRNEDELQIDGVYVGMGENVRHWIPSEPEKCFGNDHRRTS